MEFVGASRLRQPQLVAKSGIPGWIRTNDPLLRRQPNTLKMLNKLTVSELAELSKFSKAYISQVKHGIRPPSQQLLDVIAQRLQPGKDYFSIFLRSREAMGATPKTLRFYKQRLSQFISSVDYLNAGRQNVEQYLNSIPPNHNGLATRHASFRTIKTFYRWLNTEYAIKNPINGMSAPILGKPILPSLDKNQVLQLIKQAPNVRGKAIVALFVESGLRLSELTNIRLECIDWGRVPSES